MAIASGISTLINFQIGPSPIASAGSTKERINLC